VNNAVWLLLFVRPSRYEPATRPDGRFATTLWFVTEIRTSGVLSSVTVGAVPAGSKRCPATVSWLVEGLTTAPKITGTVAL
jgi:hypothetical protein